MKKSYQNLKRSVVAFTCPPDEKYPEIIGTGFVVREDGIIATNYHITKHILDLKKRHRFKNRFPVQARIFTFTPYGMLEIPLEILAIYYPFEDKDDSPYLSFVHVKAKGLPAVTIEKSIMIEEGIEIGTTGFPMGIEGLKASGKFQAMPTLQKGIISAVQSYPCKDPFSFSINVMVQGGASGSPVFSWKNGKVLGVIFSGLDDYDFISKKNVHRTPTNISYVIPSHYIIKGLKSLQQKKVTLPSDAISFKEMLKETIPFLQNMCRKS